MNNIVEKINNQSLMIYSKSNSSFTLQNKEIHTLGPTGDINTERPTAGIWDAWIVKDGFNYKLNRIDSARYLNLQDSQLESDVPVYFYYNNKFPLGELYLYPVPNEGVKILLSLQSELPQFETLDDIVNLPNGYLNYIEYKLAIRLCAVFGKMVPENIREELKVSEIEIKNINGDQHIVQIFSEYSYSSNRGSGSNYNNDYWRF